MAEETGATIAQALGSPIDESDYLLIFFRNQANKPQ
jgi:hypothetical protein